jgi:hypothetical protein
MSKETSSKFQLSFPLGSNQDHTSQGLGEPVPLEQKQILSQLSLRQSPEFDFVTTLVAPGLLAIAAGHSILQICYRCLRLHDAAARLRATSHVPDQHAPTVFFWIIEAVPKLRIGKPLQPERMPLFTKC